PPHLRKPYQNQLNKILTEMAEQAAAGGNATAAANGNGTAATSNGSTAAASAQDDAVRQRLQAAEAEWTPQAGVSYSPVSSEEQKKLVAVLESQQLLLPLLPEEESGSGGQLLPY
ncbi:hypothetical protein Agub_g13854, partial [Astrephomene gubernaculifera]